MDWVVIIAKVVLLIAGGMSKSKAVSAAAKEFGVTASAINKKGGF